MSALQANPEPSVVIRLARPRNTNRGRRFPPEPYTVDEVARLLAACVPPAPGRYGELSAMRLRVLVVVLWRSGLRISEALALEEHDLHRGDLAIVVRCGKGGKRRIVAMDEWAWREMDHWLGARLEVPRGALIPILRGVGAGRPLSATDARRQLREAGLRAGLRRRVNPHAFRHTCAVEMWREGIPEYVIQQQLGHARLDVTAAYLRGLAPLELLERVGQRRPPMVLLPPGAV